MLFYESWFTVFLILTKNVVKCLKGFLILGSVKFNSKTMKSLSIFIAVILFCSFTNLNAQESQKDFYWNKAAKYGRMKNAGVGLTIGGIITTVIGVKLLSDAVSDELNNNNYGTSNDDNSGKYLGGLVFTELGVGMTAGGIVLWSIGGAKKNKYLSKVKSLSFELNPESSRKLSLTYKF